MQVIRDKTSLLDSTRLAGQLTGMCNGKHRNLNFIFSKLYLDYNRRAPQTKKHKTWDGDAVVAATSGPGGLRCVLFDTEGNT